MSGLKTNSSSNVGAVQPARIETSQPCALAVTAEPRKMATLETEAALLTWLAVRLGPALANESSCPLRVGGSELEIVARPIVESVQDFSQVHRRFVLPYAAAATGTAVSGRAHRMG